MENLVQYFLILLTIIAMSINLVSDINLPLYPLEGFSSINISSKDDNIAAVCFPCECDPILRLNFAEGIFKSLKKYLIY